MELKKSIGSIGVGLVALASIALPVAVVGQLYTATLTDVGGSGGESWGSSRRVSASTCVPA